MVPYWHRPWIQDNEGASVPSNLEDCVVHVCFECCRYWNTAILGARHLLDTRCMTSSSCQDSFKFLLDSVTFKFFSGLSFSYPSHLHNTKLFTWHHNVSNVHVVHLLVDTPCLLGAPCILGGQCLLGGWHILDRRLIVGTMRMMWGKARGLNNGTKDKLKFRRWKTFETIMKTTRATTRMTTNTTIHHTCFEGQTGSMEVVMGN